MKKKICLFILILYNVYGFPKRNSFVQKMYDELNKSNTSIITTSIPILTLKNVSMPNIEKIFQSLNKKEQAAFRIYVLAKGYAIRSNLKLSDDLHNMQAFRYIPEKTFMKLERFHIPPAYLNIVVNKIMKQHEGMKLEHIKNLISCEIACMPSGECLDPCFQNICC